MSVCVDSCWICGRKFYRSSNKGIFHSLPIFSCQRFLLRVLHLSKLGAEWAKTSLGRSFTHLKADRERIKIGTDFTPYFVRFGNFIHYVAHHHYKFLFMTLFIARIDCSLYKMLLTLLIIQAQYSTLLTLKWVYHILHHTVKRLNVGKWGWCTVVDKLLLKLPHRWTANTK